MSFVRKSTFAVLGLFAMLLSSIATAELRTFLEPRLIDEMDTVRLIIRADGTSQTDAPDVTPLNEDFEVLGNQTSSRISSINGRTLASVEYQITLRPKRTGELTVPGLKVGDETSEAIALIVRPLDSALKETISTMVFFETELSNNPVYVQAETTLTRRLYYSQGVQIYSDLPGVPAVENAVVIPLGETQSRSTTRDGRRYGVIEQRFALFPEQSGTLHIPAISVTSSVRLQSGGRTRRSGIRVSTEAIDLEVLPIPASYPADASWLPATAVSLTQLWEPTVRSIDIGEPLRFEVDVTATGNRGSAIPPVPLPLPAEQFKIYPEAPVMEESADAGTIVGRRRETYALIPTRPGDVNVPPLTITWWDTANDQLRQTAVDVNNLTITGRPVAPPVSEEAVDASTPAAEGTPLAVQRSFSTDLMLRVLAAATLALAALIMGGWSVRRLRTRYGTVLARWLPIHSADEAGRQTDRRRLFKLLQAAAGQQDLTAFRQALARYLMNCYELPAGAALETFSRHPEAARQLEVLNRAVYAADSADQPDLQTLVTLARIAGRRQSQAKDDPLPALFS